VPQRGLAELAANSVARRDSIRIREYVRHPLVEWAAVATAWLAALLTGGNQIAILVHPAMRPFWHLSAALAVVTLAMALSQRHWRWALGPAVATLLLRWLGWLTLPLVLAAWLGLTIPWRFRHDRLWVGRTRWGRPTGISPDDRLLHCHVIGPTGSGKSTTVLLPWMQQDIEQGQSFTLIEPKGDLADRVRADAIRHHGLLLRLDPTRPGSPHWNPLAGDGAAAGEGLALALDQLDPAGHPFYQTVGRVLLVQVSRAVRAARGPDGSLEDVLRALREPAWRAGLVQEAGIPEVQAYLEEDFARLTPARQKELQLGLSHRLEALFLHPGLRAMLSPPFDFALDEVVAGDAVRLLASFPASDLGRGARAAGTLLWHLLVQSIYRQGPSPQLRHVLYLDEFHQYVSEDLSDVLAMVRGYGLSVVLAHQDMAQLSRPLQAAVTANARSRIILGGVPAEDGVRFQADAAPYPLPVLRYMKRGQAVWLPAHRGVQGRPVVLRLPSPPGAAS
jgi:hypothetical protein